MYLCVNSLLLFDNIREHLLMVVTSYLVITNRLCRCFCMVQYFFCFFKDSSKQRNKLRKKISKEKTTMKELISVLQDIHPNPEISIKDIENGIFYWQCREEDIKGTLILYAKSSTVRTQTRTTFQLIKLNQKSEKLN